MQTKPPKHLKTNVSSYTYLTTDINIFIISDKQNL